MCSHGFNIHFGQVEPPAGVATLLVAPKGPGHLVPQPFCERWRRSMSLIAIGDNGTEETKQIGLAYAKGIGGTRRWCHPNQLCRRNRKPISSANRLCSAVAFANWLRQATRHLVEAGYQPEMAYFECMHELKLIVDLFLPRWSQLHAL
jgi:ketol-acid reductoisomerase